MVWRVTPARAASAPGPIPRRSRTARSIDRNSRTAGRCRTNSTGCQIAATGLAPRRGGARARHLLHLINDVLDRAKTEAGKFEVRRERADVAALVHEVCDTVCGLAADK